jgi:glycosyltransferase involved in cell wall biosynthesis
LKVLIVSTPFIPVPPPTYGGLERIVYDLATGLCQLGDDVTVACPAESRLPSGVEHLSIGPARYQVQQDWVQAEKEAYDHYRPRLNEFGIIHDHSWYGWPYIARREDNSIRVLHTHHGHLNWRTPPPVRHVNLVAISQYMAALYCRNLGVPVRCVYNGVALDDYPCDLRRGTRLLYLGRIAKFKQPHVAVDVAKRAGAAVDIVGGDRFVDDLSYVERVKEACDGTHARYIGEVAHDLKSRYLQRCRAVLIPSQMGEPFGLVAVEALACGRPVVCLDDGALREIVTPSVGFVCRTPDEMVEVIKEGNDLAIRPEQCRRRAEEFSKEKMAQNYEQLYRDILAGNEW